MQEIHKKPANPEMSLNRKLYELEEDPDIKITWTLLKKQVKETTYKIFRFRGYARFPESLI